ncbi:MAG: D-alanine-D-alanine ligase [Acidobacteriota bacterium]|jgi:D-alanine-D-alanine ligase|nr:D-alanine-D-alanine ligase [Acidobacteriota bacterium]
MSESKITESEFKLNKPLRIAVLVHHELVPPDVPPDDTDPDKELRKTEDDVVFTLRGMGHEVEPIGISNDLGIIDVAIQDKRPHVAFNLLEEFDGYPLFDQHVVSYLELRKLPYTGCNPLGLTLTHDKALTKKILHYHGIDVPRFAVFPVGLKVKRPARLDFPLLVKSLVEEGSRGISQASLVETDEKLSERVEFIHRTTGKHAIAEQFIDGKEIYVSVIGNRNLQTYTPWELDMANWREDMPKIATSNVKWNIAYQEKIGVVTKPAVLSDEKERNDELLQKLQRLSKRIYRILDLSGYARLDYRITPDGRMYLLEANPNPQIARGEDFADSAAHCGVSYERLLQKIVTLALRYNPMG